MAKLDIEEKFKKDISKEVANLKEFLISQGKEIVKLKQENKSLREGSLARSDNGSLPPDLNAILDKHTKELAKQKENTTKLSKLCLGTLNELEKFEKKQERETSAQPKSEDRMKRLSDENKKLIHLVTALDQQVTVLEGKLNRTIADGERYRHSSADRAPKTGADITRDEVLRIVRDSLPPAVDNQERDAQIQSVVEEVQNIIGQVRELGMQVRDMGDKVRNMERNDTNERFGLELAETISRIEVIERQGASSQATKKAATSGVTSEETSKRLEMTVGRIDKIDREMKTYTTSANEIKDQVQKLKTNIEDSVKRSEDKINKDTKNSLALLEKELTKTTTNVNNTKTGLEDVSRKIDRIHKEEEAARAVRKDQNILSVEDVKKDFVGVKEQANYLEEKIVALQKLSESNGIESRNKCNKLNNDFELLAEKVKNMSLTIKDDKFKIDEKINKLGNQADLRSQLDEVEKRLGNVSQVSSKLEKTAVGAEELAKSCSKDLQCLKSDISSIKANVDKCAKTSDENNGKIFGCVQDCEMLKENLDKLKKAIDRRPAAEDLDKKSELSNKLYNDLSAKIDDVDSSLQKETKKTRSDLEKISKEMKSCQTKCDEVDSNKTKDIKAVKDELNSVKAANTELKSSCKDIAALKNDCDKNSKDLKNMTTRIDEIKKDCVSLKSDSSSLSSKIEKIQLMEKEIEQMKKEKNYDKLTSIEKDISSLRADHEKLNKDVKSVSTEVKYVDSTMKKDTSNTKTEINSFSKTIKDFEKDLNTIHNMIDVLNTEKGGNVNVEEITKINAEIKKISKEGVDKNKQIEDNLTKKINADIKDIDSKVQKIKDDLVSKCSGIEKKFDSSSKGITETEVNRLIKLSKDDVAASVEKVKKGKDEVQASVDKLKDDVKKINEMQTKQIKQDDTIAKLQKTVDSLDSSNKLNKSGDDLKKEIEKINNQIKEAVKSMDTKLSAQEKTFDGKIVKSDNQVLEIKNSMKDLTSKINTSKPDDSLKKDIDKINTQISNQDKTLTDKITKQINESQKNLQDKITAQEKSVKDVSDKIAKLEKSDGASSSKAGGETAKLATLTKAIDSIQENSKSLETMVKKMKTEFATPKDLEKLRMDLSSKAGGGKLDPTHPDMGPIMDSLIMTNDRPYIDCSTTTPMTGTGLVKFERFTAINKLPWDDVNDQFIIQEPGVYAVYVTAILQDATLSVKIASNMLEREIFNVGSREGLVGCATPSYVSRSGLLQIDDDENVAETVIVEIHADNDDSFVDKNVTFTMFKIGESPGGD